MRMPIREIDASSLNSNRHGYTAKLGAVKFLVVKKFSLWGQQTALQLEGIFIDEGRVQQMGQFQMGRAGSGLVSDETVSDLTWRVVSNCRVHKSWLSRPGQCTDSSHM